MPEKWVKTERPRERRCIVLVEKDKMAEHFTRFAKKKLTKLGRTEEASKNTSRRMASAIQRIFAELNTPLYWEPCQKIDE